MPQPIKDRIRSSRAQVLLAYVAELLLDLLVRLRRPDVIGITTRFSYDDFAAVKHNGYARAVLDRQPIEGLGELRILDDFDLPQQGAQLWIPEVGIVE